jgi:hypothetical protein
MDTSEVSGRIDSANNLRSIRPEDLTGKYVTSNPSSDKTRHESSTHLCSYKQSKKK